MTIEKIKSEKAEAEKFITQVKAMDDARTQRLHDVLTGMELERMAAAKKTAANEDHNG